MIPSSWDSWKNPTSTLLANLENSCSRTLSVEVLDAKIAEQYHVANESESQVSGDSVSVVEHVDELVEEVGEEEHLSSFIVVDLWGGRKRGGGGGGQNVPGEANVGVDEPLGSFSTREESIGVDICSKIVAETSLDTLPALRS